MLPDHVLLVHREPSIIPISREVAWEQASCKECGNDGFIARHIVRAYRRFVHELEFMCFECKIKELHGETIK